VPGSDSHVPEVFWDSDGDLVEGVSGGGAVGVDGPDAFVRDDLVVCGVAGCVLDDVELKGSNRDKGSQRQMAREIKVVLKSI
jgi:hypothetical protein